MGLKLKTPTFFFGYMFFERAMFIEDEKHTWLDHYHHELISLILLFTFWGQSYVHIH